MMNKKPEQSKILVVDDIPLNRKLQKTYLESVGYQVILANDGIEALQRIDEERPDLILLDVMMPKMNGFQVCRRLKSLESTRFIPIIMVTALNEVDDKVRGIEAGADDFISKPFNKLELLARVKSLLRIKYLHDELELKIKELEIAQSKLIQLAITDGLTGLYNYRYFKEQLTQEITRAKRHNSHVSISMIDIDYFKNYNDTHGHPAGDQVLKTIADLLRNNIRKIDIAARYGGEEFALILVETDKQAAGVVANKIKNLIEHQKFHYEETQPNGKLTISMGVATFPEDAMTPEELVKIADQRLYLAKKAGRNRVVLG
ncbi:MAG: PleD family two-component system response regulator [candidate division KSB1 bacterium]|nr:PleD family two-component system response regulator [candidate division KSB1 bacterium]